jgi:hypothetical protein
MTYIKREAIISLMKLKCLNVWFAKHASDNSLVPAFLCPEVQAAMPYYNGTNMGIEERFGTLEHFGALCLRSVLQCALTSHTLT